VSFCEYGDMMLTGSARLSNIGFNNLRTITINVAYNGPRVAQSVWSDLQASLAAPVATA
jgi:hypothetical protein